MLITGADDTLYEPKLLPDGMPATRVGSLWDPTLFIRCQESTLPFVRGAILVMSNPQNFTGSAGEIEAAQRVMVEQALADALTQQEVCQGQAWGADFRALLGGMLQAMQGENLPLPPWEFRIVPQEDGSVMLQFRTQEGEP